MASILFGAGSPRVITARSPSLKTQSIAFTQARVAP
jgi:hypothetical protein